MGFILFEEEDLKQVAREVLGQFGDSNLQSEAARKEISRRIHEEILERSDEIDGQSFMSGYEN